MHRPSPMAPLSSSTPEDPLTLAQRAFRPSGGLLTADALAHRLEDAQGQGVRRVARWIVDRTLLCVHLQGCYWVPRFQLCPASWKPHAAVAGVLAELPAPRPEWRWTDWFAEPNDVLGGARPADRWAQAPEEVRQAARLLRFARMG